jgi:hypothetical protein
MARPHGRYRPWLEVADEVWKDSRMVMIGPALVELALDAGPAASATSRSTDRSDDR